MIALNSLCIVGLVVCVVFLAAIGLHWSVKRYLIPAIGRRQWIREYRRQRAREYAAMMAVFAPTPEETADAEEDGLRYHEQIETPPTPVRR